MKHILYLATLLLPLFAMAQTESKIIETDIRGRSCSGGLGLCNIQAPSESGKTLSTSKTTIRILTLDTFILEIDKKQLTESEEKSITDKSLKSISQSEAMTFIQEADLVIDNDTLVYLGLDSKFNLIKAGNYPMTVTPEKITISFSLTHN